MSVSPLLVCTGRTFVRWAQNRRASDESEGSRGMGIRMSRRVTLLGESSVEAAADIAEASVSARARTPPRRGAVYRSIRGIPRRGSSSMNAGEAVGERGIRDLEHVLGVQLAGVGEVEAADEDDVVGDRHLRVHVVVHRAGAVRASSACPRRAPASSAVRRSGSFQEAFPFSCHWRSTSWTWVRSTTPARSTLPSEATWASVPRIGAGADHGRGDPDPAAWPCRSPSRSGGRASRRGRGKTRLARAFRRRRRARCRPCRSSGRPAASRAARSPRRSGPRAPASRP